MWTSNKKPPSLESTHKQETLALPNTKLRSACDRCHQSKMKCSGGMPCTGCSNSGADCSYSVSHRSGRPKGAKNKQNHNQMSVAQQDNFPSFPTTPGSKTPPQSSQHIQQPMTPVMPCIDNTSFSSSSSTFWELFNMEPQKVFDELMGTSEVLPDLSFQALQLTLRYHVISLILISRTNPEQLPTRLQTSSSLLPLITLEGPRRN